MKFFRNLSIFLALAILSLSIMAAKVYLPSGTTVNKTYKGAGIVSLIQNPAFDQIAVLGMVDDVYVDVVYGENPAVASTSEDIWDGGTTYVWSADATADIKSMASSDASGDESITIKGLNVTGDLVSQTITLTGSTRVALTTFLWRFLSAENDATNDIAGNVFIYTGTSTIPSLAGSTVRGVILSGNNKTYSTIYTVPDDKVGLVYSTGAHISLKDATGDATSRATLLSRKYGKTFTKLDSTILETGILGYSDDNLLGVITGKSDLKYAISDATGDSVGIVGKFKVLIVPELKLETSFLTGIGQPGY